MTWTGRKSLKVRFWEKVDVRRGSECWEWQAGRKARGYGTFDCQGKPTPAHRMAYTLTLGPIPEGLVIDHLCSNPPCVNPVHLEPVTQAENTRRGRAGAAQRARRARQTHCKNGHEFTADNTYRDPKKNSRSCKTCRAAALERYRSKKGSGS